MATTYELIRAWESLLMLCRLRDDETVLILVGEITHPEHLQAAELALAMRGVRSLVVRLGEVVGRRMAGESTALYAPTALTGNKPALEAMMRSDLVIDMMGMYRGSEQEAILDAGTRIVLVKEPPEVFIRLAPNPALRQRVLDAAERLRRATTMHVTSPAGTDLRVFLGDLALLTQHGCADERGRWDHCPSAFVATWPNEGSAQGEVVLSPGDTILPFKAYVRTPIRMTIRNGYVCEIEGDLDARHLRDYMASFRDPEGYAVSHLGWGLDERASWTSLGMYDKRQTNAQEARSFAGCFMFSVGPNAEGGGNRHTACHLDIPMLDCTVMIDGAQVVQEGQLS